MSIQYMSEDGLNKLKEKLDYLMKEKRRECAHDLQVARSFGDLSENAEYDAAKEKLNNNERDIKELSDKLSDARILDDSKIPKDKVFIGAIVKLKDITDNEEVEYTLVSSLEADIAAGKISVASPLGKALLGHGKGETIAITAPNGRVMKHKILSIRR